MIEKIALDLGREEGDLEVLLKGGREVERGGVVVKEILVFNIKYIYEYTRG